MCVFTMCSLSHHLPSSLLTAAQVPDSDEQFVPDFHSENCKYSLELLINNVAMYACL